MLTRPLTRSLVRPLIGVGSGPAPETTPVFTSPPQITGNPYLGQTVTGTGGVVTGGGISRTYRWLLDDVPIVGQTGNTLLIVEDYENGGELKFEVTATNTVGSAVSTSSAVVILWPPEYVSGGTISGGTGLNDTLTASDPTWTGATSTSREWYKNGVSTGSTGTTYSAARVHGDSMTVVFSASNAAGSEEHTSNAIVAVQPAPSRVSGGSISGGTGLNDTLTASDPVWSDAVSTGRTWFKNGTSTGATGSTYSIARLNGDVMKVRFSATNPGGTTTYDSNEITASAGGTPPVISGTAYPGETLTSTQAGQWRVGGVDVSGQTGTTFVLRVQDIGAVIGQTNSNGSSNTLTCWKPGDVPGVVSCRVAFAGVLFSVGPDTPATVGQTIRRWNDVVAGHEANQATGVNQPILQEVNGMRYGAFDGSNDNMALAEVAFRNVAQSFHIASVFDNSNTGTNATRTITAEQTTVGGIRSALLARMSANGVVSSTPLTNNSNTNNAISTVKTNDGMVVSGIVDRSVPTHTLRVNGSQEAQTTVAGLSPISPDVAPTSITIGAPSNTLSGGLFCLIRGNGPLTATQLSQLERFAMLCAGPNYVGADIPLV